jgi:hypothetical protein
MRKVAAVAVAAMTMAGLGMAQSGFRGGSLVNRAVVRQAAAQIVKATPSLAASGAGAGYLPVFTDSSGDLQNSALFQLNAGTVSNPVWNLGLGTITPSFNLQFVSTVDPAAVDVDGYGIVGINFIGRRADGTLAAPTAILANDNIMAMQGRGYGTTGFSTASRAYMKFFAAENWTDAAQGTYIDFATTPKGTASSVERLRILDNGNVGIGTATPASPLTVAGAIRSTTGGFVFPDATVQATAAVSGVAMTSPDGSITVGGTATAPTVAANPAMVQARVTGTCAAGTAMTGVTAAGAVNCGTIGAGGSLANVPVVVASTSFTGSYGVGTPKTIYTATADGFYRVSVYMNVPTTGTCTTAPCEGEQIALQWNDGISTLTQSTANCNLVSACGSSVVTSVWVKSGQSITAFGENYGTGNTPTGGSYNAYVLVEQM